MLKIKDDIDLSILEKYNFYKKGSKYVIDSEASISPSDRHKIKKHYTLIVHGNRKLELTNKYKRLDILFDLIKDGLVEKVDE